MRLEELPEHVEHFRARVMADALQEATAAYWRRRARALTAALPRPDDYTGRATPEQIEERRQRVASAALACNQRAALMLGGDRA